MDINDKFVNGQTLQIFWQHIKQYVEKRIDEKIDEMLNGKTPTPQKNPDDITCWERWWGDENKQT